MPQGLGWSPLYRWLNQGGTSAPVFAATCGNRLRHWLLGNEAPQTSRHARALFRRLIKGPGASTVSYQLMPRIASCLLTYLGGVAPVISEEKPSPWIQRDNRLRGGGHSLTDFPTTLGDFQAY